MPKPSVFTPEQQAFLRPYTDGFKDARARRRKPQFREDVGQPFLEKWPVVIPDNWVPIFDPPMPSPPPGADPAEIPLPPPEPPSEEEQRRNYLYLNPANHELVR